MSDPARLLLVVAAGFLAGLMNTVAGGGSLVSLPALIFLGLPASVANATNRVAIVAQNLFAAREFKARGVGGLRLGARLSPAAGLGAALGAYAAAGIDERQMRLVLAAVMLLLLGVIAARPERWVEGNALRRARGATAALHLTFFALGAYGGFIQAGVGVFILAALVLQGGLDLLEANAAKTLSILLLTLPALAVFLWKGLVDWRWGLSLAAGNLCGAWVGAWLAVRGGAPWLRRALILVVLASALELLGARPFLARLLAP